ncbi:MAG: DUF368 domain-containing protein [Clostridiales bacterium]|nr:DUF368 domain-containing protein [Clostridiales bacterium]
MKDFIKKIICGIAIGVGCVLPGVSGGVIAISMGLYEKMITAIKQLFSAFKKNFMFLLPIGIGCAAGVVLTSNVLKLVIDQYESELFALFVGFVIGSFPSLFEETKKPGQKRFSVSNIAIMIIAFVLIILMEILDTNATAKAVGADAAGLTPLEAMISGAILSIGVVIPGLSSSFLLVYFGMYKPVLAAIAEIDVSVLFFAGIGFAVLGMLLILLMHFLLSRYHVKTYFGIIGVAAGTIALIIPNIAHHFSWVCILLLAVGIAVGLWQAKRRMKLQKKDVEISMPL